MLAQTDFNLSAEDFNLIREVVYKHCGISLSEEKISLVRARLTKHIRAGGFNSAKEYLDDALEDQDSQAFVDFINSISTNLTSFFRENQHYEFLSNSFLPQLLAKKRDSGDGRVLAWCAACSSGEEPYSMAITLLDAAQKINSGAIRWDFRLLATDISTTMLTTARAGKYPASRLATVPQKHRVHYFEPAAGSIDSQMYAVTYELRQMVRFRHLNLMGSWPFSGPFDFIFCRNVMIYFDKQTQQQLVDRFWKCLSPGGLLFTGHSESLMGITHRFAHRRASIYEKSES